MLGGRLMPLALLAYWREALIAIAVAAALWFRAEAAQCHAAREADRAAAEQAKAAALADAQARSDRIITEQAQALAATAARATEVRERIVNVPVQTACASSPAVRLGLDGLRDAIHPGGSHP